MSSVEPIRNIEDIKKIENFLLNKNKRDLLLFTIGTNCGLRISDILALNVEDVKNKDFLQITEKKTKKFKKIPINKKLKELISDYTKDKNNKDALFKTIFGNRLERVGAYYIIKTVCMKVGIQEKIGTHTLRKTFGYHHYKRNKDIAILQKIFNHSSMEITLRYIGIEQEEIYQSYLEFVL